MSFVDRDRKDIHIIIRIKKRLGEFRSIETKGK